MAKLRVAVFFGGVSSEHEISLKLAAFVIRTMDRSKYHIIKIGITKKGQWMYFPGDVSMIEDGTWETHPDCVPAVLSQSRSTRGILKLLEDGTYATSKVDVAMPILHGKNGEDGTIQGLFTLAGIPYVGCDLISSANCMDKDITKILLSHAGVPNTPWLLTTPSLMSKSDDFADRVEQELSFPVFVKPCNAGSSVGVSKASDRDQLKVAINSAFAHDRRVIIEKAINAREIECSVLGDDDVIVSVPGEIVPQSEFYDYEAKYISGTSRMLIPAPLTKSQTQTIRQLAEAGYRALGCNGFARVDFFIDKDTGEILLNEINTIPGFTSASMYAKLMEASGIPNEDLIDRLINLAIERAE